MLHTIHFHTCISQLYECSKPIHIEQSKRKTFILLRSIHLAFASIAKPSIHCLQFSYLESDPSKKTSHCIPTISNILAIHLAIPTRSIGILSIINTTPTPFKPLYLSLPNSQTPQNTSPNPRNSKPNSKLDGSKLSSCEYHPTPHLIFFNPPSNNL